MNVTIFGGASPKAGDAAYQQAYVLGKTLAEQGCTILTGGYIGTMEAASKGAFDGGGHVIGVTCADIEAWRGVKANPWVKEEWRYATLRERLCALIDGCDAAIALPGGVGTLVEISLTGNELIIGSQAGKPLILVGEGWKQTMQTFFNQFEEYTSSALRNLITCVDDVHAAAAIISNYKQSPS